MKVWFNGRIVHAAQAHLSVFDHGFLYGDGLYETVRVIDGRILFWADHYVRLKKASKALSFSLPLSKRAFAEAIQAVALANRRSDATARVTLSRGTGSLGLSPALCPTPTVVVQLHPERRLEREHQAGVAVAIVQTRRTTPASLNPAFKSISMQNLVQARLEATHLRVFEGVLRNEKGALTEGTTSNIFFVRRHQLYTPSIACGILPGVTRAHVLRLAQAAGVRVHEGRYRPADLQRAQEMMLTNTTIDILPVALLKHGARTTHFKDPANAPVTRLLCALWQRATRR